MAADTPDLATRKCFLRADVRASRRARDEVDRAAADAAIARHGADLVRRLGARTVACYLSTPTEPGTRGLIDALTAAGMRVLLPRPIDDGRLEWVAAGDGERMHALRVPEPCGPALGDDALAAADLVLVPAAAVDGRGGRLGWGGGFYDRALAGLRGGAAAGRTQAGRSASDVGAGGADAGGLDASRAASDADARAAPAASRDAPRALVVAIVFDDEVRDALPLEPHDAMIDGVLTPTGLR